MVDVVNFGGRGLQVLARLCRGSKGPGLKPISYTRLFVGLKPYANPKGNGKAMPSKVYWLKDREGCCWLASSGPSPFDFAQGQDDGKN
jgi:hypothetical protein